MKVSVITPTADREDLLKGTYSLLKRQNYPNWEWLIYDTSVRPTSFNDVRIQYFYDEKIVSIGEKRNRLIEKASGDVIIHFDDDDYYAPTYIEKMIQQLRKCSFFTFHAWFSYDAKLDQFFYWDTEESGSFRYFINPISGLRLREIEFGHALQEQKELLDYKGKTGYGFSYAYSKEVSNQCAFKDIDLAEDRHFYEDASAAGFLIRTEADQEGVCVHIIHDENTSGEYPQYRIPRFLVKELLSPFFSYYKASYEDRSFSGS